MSEKRSNILIPNAVGRLDPVVNAIRAENWTDVMVLVDEERLRRAKKRAYLEGLLIKESWDVRQIEGFYEGIFNPLFRERVLQEANQ